MNRFLVKLFALIFAISVAYLAAKCFETPELPNIEAAWWGEGNEIEKNGTEEFKIKISSEIISDLNKRIERTRNLPRSLDNSEQSYGLNVALLEDISFYWRFAYIWKEREVFLNKFPQYKVQVQGLNIHYIHVKPEIKASNVKVVPLLMLHSWPGSVREFYDLIPILTETKIGKNLVFEVLAPSLPGFGFSDATKKPGLGLAEVSVLIKNFMEKLGFRQYYVHGGDLGAVIAQTIATLFPEKLLGIHSNTCYSYSIFSELKIIAASLIPSFIVRKEHQDKIYPLSKLYKYRFQNSGHLHFQATKPDTIGFALSDSPVGLLGYMLDKFLSHANSTYYKPHIIDDMETKYSFDAILDNVMIYWLTKSMTTSMRIYAETFTENYFNLKLDLIPTEVPTACSRFSDTLLYQPDCILKDKFSNLVYSNDLEGGRYASLENPELVANEIQTGIEKIEEYLHTEVNRWI